MKTKNCIFRIFIVLFIIFLCSCVGMETVENESNETINQEIAKAQTAQGVEFRFKGKPVSGGFFYKVPISGEETYNINQSLKKLLKDWCEINFGRIEENSIDEITVKIKDLDYDGGENTFLKSIYLEVNVHGNIKDNFFDKDIALSRSFSRAVSANPNFKGSTLANKAKTNINRFLMQLVEKIDNYLKKDIHKN